MKRKQFLKTCGYVALAVPFTGILYSGGGIYYAKVKEGEDSISLTKSEFIANAEKPEEKRDFVLVETSRYHFPICLYRIEENQYTASLLKCTHRGCELNVGGGIYSCPCHGSEFSNKGEVLSGPADQKLKTFTTKTNTENVIIHLS